MSTIIERAGMGGHAICAAAVLAVWFVGIGLVTVLAEPTATVVLIAPPGTALRAAIASNTDLLDERAGLLRVRSDRKGFVRDLYANGVWFVWPAVSAGCVASSAEPKAARAGIRSRSATPRP